MTLPTLTVSDSSGFELHEADEWYDAHINDIEAKDDGLYGPELKWILILEGADADSSVWAFCSQKLSPRSKLFGWAKALGYDLDQPLNIGDLVGDKCQIMFERYQGTDQDNNPLEKEKVVKIRAPKGGQAKAKIVAPTAAPSNDLDAPF